MSDGPEPTHDDLAGRAIPATYRRAPRTERFIATGVGIGAAVGLIIGLVLPAGTVAGRGMVGLIAALAGALAGGLITGAQAATLEYTSGRSADRQRQDILHSPAIFLPPADASGTPAAATPDEDDDATR